MIFTISAQHTELTPGLEQAVKDKFSRFQMHAEGQPAQEEKTKNGGKDNGSVHAHVILRVDSGQHVVEASVTGLGTKTLVAKAVKKDMYESINEASRIIDRQWRKQKTATLARRRKDSIKKMSI